MYPWLGINDIREWAVIELNKMDHIASSGHSLKLHELCCDNSLKVSGHF